MAASLYKAQFALRLCERHEKKKLHAFCKTCQEKVCSACVKEDHSSHDWEIISDFLREKKQNLPSECREIRSNQLPRLKNEIDRYEKKIQELDVCLEQNESALNGHRKRYIDKINKLYDVRLAECRQKTEASKQKYMEERDGLKSKVKYLDMITTSLDKDINTLPDHDILDMEQEMRNELEKALFYSADKNTCTKFVPMQINAKAWEKMIDEIHFVSVEEENDIEVSSGIVEGIKPTSDKNVWIKSENEAILTGTAGSPLRRINTCCSDFIISDNGNMIMVLSKKIVIRSEENGQKIAEFHTEPFRPTKVSKTDNDEILVILGDLDDSNLPTSRRMVRRMTLTGKVLHTYEFREDGKTRLFHHPLSTIENKNTDVCTINWPNDDSGEIVILHKDGRVKSTFSLYGWNVNKFKPIDIECDSKSNILFTELYSRAVHMLNADGQYLCKLLQFEEKLVAAVAILGDRLWCGFCNGRVKVYKYKN
ncbi:hypothetical protein FSP39_000328 [Pinctada imbricata]|uniref:B box-type domain-containing protein n=1 Tax=Pinctada imbricata TaxID=66713 RepID=A0AA88XYD0_PINIB|nr:hypothetical protein FSP39_000328 [Pinctada imbricata]